MQKRSIAQVVGRTRDFQVVGTAETFAVCRLGVPGLIDRGFPGADGAC
jgi:hypothetical protein